MEGGVEDDVVGGTGRNGTGRAEGPMQLSKAA